MLINNVYEMGSRVFKGMCALVALVLLACLFCNHAELRLTDVSTSSVQSRPLPTGHALTKYMWLSTEELIIGTQNRNDESVIWQLDFQSGRSRSLVELNALLKDLQSGNDRILDWSVASNRTTIMCVGDLLGRGTAMKVDLCGRPFGEAISFAGLRRVYSPMWLSAANAWVVAGVSTNATQALVWTGESRARHVLLHTNVAFPIGVRGGSEILLFEAQQVPTEIRLLEATLNEKISLRSHNIRLPFKCQVISARLSPSGERILWELRRTSFLPKLRRSGSFPFLKFVKDPGESSLWISNADGTRFAGLGFVPGSRIGNFIEWYPDETKISMVWSGELILLEIPRKMHCKP
jgi:hypothetical protein